MVARRPVGDGHAAVGHHDDRHHGPGVPERDALPAVLLRAAARDGDPVGHARAVLPQGEHLHGVSVPRDALRLEDAVVHRVPLPDVAQPVVQRRHLRAGGGDVGDPRPQHDDHLPADRHPHDHLHDVRRRARGGLHRRQADGGGGVEPAHRGHGAHHRPARHGDPPRRAARGRLHRPAADVRLPPRLHRAVHVLVGHDRGAVPVPVVLRHRPEPGAAVPRRQVGGRGAHVTADERLLEDPAAGARAHRGRDDVRVLPVLDAADALQPRARAAGSGERARGRLRGHRAAVRRRRSASEARRRTS